MEPGSARLHRRRRRRCRCCCRSLCPARGLPPSLPRAALDPPRARLGIPQLPGPAPARSGSPPAGRAARTGPDPGAGRETPAAGSGVDGNRGEGGTGRGRLSFVPRRLPCAGRGRLKGHGRRAGVGRGTWGVRGGAAAGGGLRGGRSPGGLGPAAHICSGVLKPAPLEIWNLPGPAISPLPPFPCVASLCQLCFLHPGGERGGPGSSWRPLHR